APKSLPQPKAEKEMQKDIAKTEKTEHEKSSAAVEKPEKTESRSAARIVKKEKASPVPAVKPESEVRPQAERSEESIAQKSVSQPQKNAYLYIAKDYESKKDYPKALAYYKKVLETDRYNFVVINNTAYILLNMGLVHESIKYSLIALELKKDYVPALINLGDAYARADNLPAAENSLNKAVTIEPDNQTASLNLAVLYEKQREYQKAFEYFSKLARMGNAHGFMGIARIYEKQGKTEEALKTYKNISSFSSVDADTKKMVEQRIELLSEKLKSGK
ncbi:MAG: tetratricopeptide repeat protein, partial [Nitrospirae bacterium]|nr:tetratricopeptide repeat protein [Nitrospirota bacterium]